MVLVKDRTLEDLRDLQNEIAARARECTSLEAAAQMYVSTLFERLSDSIVLVRFFSTLPFIELPVRDRAFVERLAESAGISDEINENTLVLTLLGTRGIDPEWNERENSREHLGIPLVSSDFIEAIPMMSRLLKQLGVRLDWIDNDDTHMVLRTVGKMSGIFHVRDARTEVDMAGRKIIAAQDFVSANDVKTVFGLGGGYLGSKMFFVTILFLNETLERQFIDRFMLQSNKFKTATMKLVYDGKIFNRIRQPSAVSPILI